jgi:hypothetical protein
MPSANTANTGLPTKKHDTKGLEELRKAVSTTRKIRSFQQDSEHNRRNELSELPSATLLVSTSRAFGVVTLRLGVVDCLLAVTEPEASSAPCSPLEFMIT